MLRLSHVVVIASALFASAAIAQAPAKPAPKKPDPAVQKCMAAYNTENAAMNKTYQGGVKAGKIDKAEQAKWAEMSKKIAADIAKSKQGGVTLQECEGVRNELKAKHAELNKMIASAPKEDPAVKKCLADYNTLNAAVNKKHADGKKAGKIDAAEEKRWAAESKRLNAHIAAAKKGGISMQECQRLTAELKHKETDLDKMLASAPAKAPAKLPPKK